jgi:hypothetical protein
VGSVGPAPRHCCRVRPFLSGRVSRAPLRLAAAPATATPGAPGAGPGRVVDRRCTSTTLPAGRPLVRRVACAACAHVAFRRRVL